MKTKELMKQLEEGVEQVFKSGNFKEWLKVQQIFHNYSYCNTMLILLQRSNATQVAGYRTWEKLRRYVKRGEKGIAILAPMITRQKDKDGKMEESVLYGFKPVYVFDISQTEGKDLPEIAKEITTSSQVAQEMIPKLHEIASKKDIKIVYFQGRPDEAMGYYAPQTNEIGLIEASADQQAKTYIHELAHALTYTEDANYQEGELIAEGTAFIVAAHFGLDTSSYSFEYVAAWASRAEKDALKKVARTIQKTANHFIQEMETKKEKILVG